MLLCCFPEFEHLKYEIILLEMPRQLRKHQAFPEMPDFRNCLRHIYIQNVIKSSSQHLVLRILRILRFLRRREGQNTYALTPKD